MNTNLNLQPLQEFLTTGITPQELSVLIDEMLFDYFRLIVSSVQNREDPDEDASVHPEANQFVHNLRELKNALVLCN